MLAKRIVTAVVLLAVLLPAILVAPDWVWGVVSLAFLAVAGWEWANLVPDRARRRTAVALVALAGGAVLVARARWNWPEGALLAACLLLTVFWSVLGPARLARHAAHRGGWPLGAALLFGCWIALYELRAIGPVALLSSMAVVWVADVGAYFVGRAFGRRKLAPSISPGKSWEGAFGGAAAVVAAGLLAAGVPSLSESLPALLVRSLSPWLAVAALVALVALSIVGDLHESLLKRRAGVKDSGTILPGHGGVLDRIDALLPAMPAALLLYLVLR
ncbi:MAG: phosphatidate cytidylyltransferase [Burkholderiaceae bacterium]|nr:phosphatidate cytidylyltransferase [Burkholderiaceae bacterium]